jgi:hypothetical protein
MVAAMRRLLILVLAGVGACAQTAKLRPEANPPEDPKLRAEAVRLLERANHVSTPAVWPPNEMTLKFRVGAPAPGDPFEGEYVSSVGVPGQRRQTWRYGNFELTQIRDGKRIAVLEPGTIAMPGVLNLLNEMAPIYLVRFDDQDIIRAITDPREGQRCIQFETVTGDRQQTNEACVEVQNGWLLSIRAGDTATTNSNFFAFEGAFLPGHIERWTAGQKAMEVDETVVLKSDYPPDYFTVPASSTGFVCQEFRRAFEVSTPQPPPGPSMDVIDVKLKGIINPNGTVTGLMPIEQTRPELTSEAMKLVATWTYKPATCAGKVVTWGTTFTVHFKGR